MLTPYYADETVTLYLGDCREVLPELGIVADVIVTDPPYGDSHLPWDQWPAGWPAVAAACAPAMWCFGSLRMFMTYGREFDAWRFSQDIVWVKNMAVGFAADRFRKRHELAAFWYRGNWEQVHKEPQRIPSDRPDQGHVRMNSARDEGTFGDAGAHAWVDNGTRLATSVINVANMHQKALHPTQKPPGILHPLIRYSCPPGGLVVDPFAGSGSTLDAARSMDRRAVGIEADERYAEIAAKRLSQGDLFASAELSTDAAVEGGGAG